MARFGEKPRNFWDPNRPLSVGHDGVNDEGEQGADPRLVAEAKQSRLQFEQDMQDALKATFSGNHPGDELRGKFGIRIKRRREADDDE